MLFLVFLGVLVVLSGILILMYPRGFKKLSEFFNRRVFDDNAVMLHRLVFSGICIAVGAALIFLSLSY